MLSRACYDIHRLHPSPLGEVDMSFKPNPHIQRVWQASHGHYPLCAKTDASCSKGLSAERSLKTLLDGSKRLSSDICCRLQKAASIQCHLLPAVPILAETPCHINVPMSVWVLPPGCSDASSEARRAFTLLRAPKSESLMTASFRVVSEPYIPARQFSGF